MNERIKELMAEASYEVRSHGAFGESERYTELDPEKFAELIIKECVTRAEREWNRNGVNTEHNKAITSVIKSIKGHFGVE